MSRRLKEQPVAPIETVARFQAGFSLSEDFHCFLSIGIDFMISMDCWAGLGLLGLLEGLVSWLCLRQA